ncbi:MAG TPA: VOC family protein [Solirubrobacteraceae bacterium]|jgi:predicted enzyme related to lactoylglutathione lyase|nr:VOC family protein [Solirubrobacteraceae bacterium]
MSERTQYPAGAFCWTDLTTTDQQAAKAFYAGLFGWEAEDMPVGEGVFYSMQRLRGKDVAAISPQPPQQREAGVPPTWNSYVSVESADAALERAKELGATVHAPAFDVLEAGRMGVIQDPQGAFLLAWEPRQHHGAALVNEPGAFVWNELNTTDPEGAIPFYSGLFGWQIEPAGGTAEPYLSIKNGEANNGGMRGLGQPGVPPHWLVYFAVEDIDAAIARVAELGGSKMVGPIDIQIAKIAVVSDPQGAFFALYAGQLDL